MKFKSPKLPFDSATIEYDNKNHALDFVLHLEPEQEKSYLNGEVLAERMKEKGLSASVLDYLLENPEKIPKEWKGKWIYFWGTIFRNANGVLYVRYLYFDDGAWQTNYFWLGFGWLVHSPSTVSASSVKSDPKFSSEPKTFDLEHRVARLENLFSKEVLTHTAE